MNSVGRSKIALSIVVLCRNERDHIGGCLDSLLSQDIPADEYEVLVVDGMSDDGTRQIVTSYSDKHANVRLVDNPSRIIPAASNVGVRASRGQVIAIVSGHASYEVDYFGDCLRALETYGADEVGAVANYAPRSNTPIGRAIAIALAHPLGGGGNARYKIGTSQPCWVDTAFAACFRRELFERVGLFREWFVRSDDMDFAIRAQRMGAKVLLLPRTGMTYHARSRLHESFKHSLDNGMWITYPLAMGVRAFRWRHLLPFFLVCGLIVPLLISAFSRRLPLFLALLPALVYLAAVQVIAFIEAMRRKDIGLSWSLMLALTTLHLAYGAGSAWGFLRAIASRLRGEKIPPPPTLSPRTPTGLHSVT